MRTAYLGPEGTFSHQAALLLAPPETTLLPCPGLPEVFEALDNGQAIFGIVPVENRLEGSVGATLEGLKATSACIQGELFLPVVHALLAPAGRTLAQVQRVHSHPQALGQCRGWLRTHLPGASPVQRLSTAEAARACLEDPEGGAIASRLAAELMGLEVLAEGIQDSPDNATRFLRLGPETPSPTGADRTSLLVQAQDRPGALLAVLAPFAERGLSLSRIESRPSRTRAWQYDFFLDVLGHPQDPAMAEALGAIAAEGVSLRLLGAYPRG